MPTPGPSRRWGVLALAALALTMSFSSPAEASAVAAAPAAQDSVVTAAPFRPAEFPPGTLSKDLPTAVAWGDAHPEGQVYGSSLGNGSGAKSFVPVLSQGGSQLTGREISQVDPGVTSTCALAVGKVYCWGNNNFGQLGNGGQGTQSDNPVLVGGALTNRTVTAISVGGFHSCAIANFRVYCWGNNQNGEVGANSLADHFPSPTAVYIGGALGTKKVTAVSAGGFHTCAVADGDVFCWGRGSTGALGDGNTALSRVPLATDQSTWGATPVTTISAGDDTTCAVAAGRASCWGANSSGQAGVGNATPILPKPTPVKTTGALKNMSVKAVSVGNGVTCAVAGVVADRRAYCWGAGTDGQLGRATAQSSSSPVAVSTAGVLKNRQISAISVNGAGGCVAPDDGKTYCWGKGDGGRLGRNNQLDSLVPTAVNGTGVLKTRRMLAVSASDTYSTGVAVTPRVFDDVAANYAFYDDITWAAGLGITHGNIDNNYEPGTNIDRQAMAAFLFRFKNPGIVVPSCDPMKERVFRDVDTETQFCGAIEWMVSAKITPAGTHFFPLKDTTRAVMATWMFRAIHPGLADQSCAGMTRLFGDVDAGTAHCGNIEWLAKVGVTNGFVDNSYQPTAGIHRDAMAAFYHRARELAAH